MATSAAWKAVFDNRIMGEQFVEVVIDCSDDEALEDSTVTVLSGQEMQYSDASSIVASDSVDRIGTLESNMWVLDSSTAWASSSSSMGYVSISLSDTDCAFKNVDAEIPHYIPSVKITLDSVMDFDGLTIKWSKTFGEWATAFTVEFLDSSNDRILLKNVTNNKSIVYAILDKVNDCKYIIITVTKWCLPERRCRIEKVISGAILSLTKKDLLKYAFSKSESPINSELPSHVVDFTIHNYDDRYSADGSLAISDYLEKQNAVHIRYGITLESGDVEYTDGGTYFIDTWDVDSTGRKIAIKARDPFYFMSNWYAKSSYIPNGISLQTIAIGILQDAMQEYNCVSTWSLDSGLANITSASYMENVTHAQALQMVAQAAGMVLSYDGTEIIISPADYTAQSSQGEIKQMNCFDYPTYELKALPNSVNCKVYTYKTDMIVIGADHYPDINGDGHVNSSDAQIVWAASVAIGTGQPTGLTNDQEIMCDCDMDGVITSWDAVLISKFAAGIGTLTYTDNLAGWNQFYNIEAGIKKAVADITMELTANAQATVVIHHAPSYDINVRCSETITSMTAYTDQTVIVLTPTSSSVTFKVYGYPITKSSHEYVQTIDANSDSVIIVDNQLITSGVVAESSIDAVTEYLGMQKSITLGNFRIDPAFTTGMATILNQSVYITDLKMTFSGMFKGSVSGKVVE